jgi:hypothetical protein
LQSFFCARKVSRRGSGLAAWWKSRRFPMAAEQRRAAQTGSGKPLTMVPANGATHARSSGEGTRNSKVVQRFEGLRLHPTPNWRRCVRALLCHHDGRLQVAERRAGGGVRSKERSERPSSRERNRPLKSVPGGIRRIEYRPLKRVSISRKQEKIVE